METFKLNKISEAVEDFRDGKFVILGDALEAHRHHIGFLSTGSEKPGVFLEYLFHVFCDHGIVLPSKYYKLRFTPLQRNPYLL